MVCKTTIKAPQVVLVLNWPRLNRVILIVRLRMSKLVKMQMPLPNLISFF